MRRLTDIDRAPVMLEVIHPIGDGAALAFAEKG